VPRQHVSSLSPVLMGSLLELVAGGLTATLLKIDVIFQNDRPI
jgi:hypothetical protein